MPESGSVGASTLTPPSPRNHKTVFLSYRRTSFPWALNIFQNLTAHGYDVFIDYTGIGSGDFAQVIEENILSRAHFVLVLTPTALSGCIDPDDWLRREIEIALKSQRNIVPVLLEGFGFSRQVARSLPEELRSLPRYNGLSVHNEYFNAAMDRLRTDYLSRPLATVLSPASSEAVSVAVAQQQAAGAAPVPEIPVGASGPQGDDGSLFSLSLAIRKFRLSIVIAATLVLGVSSYLLMQTRQGGKEPPVTSPPGGANSSTGGSSVPPAVTPSLPKPVELEVVLNRGGERRGRERTNVGEGADGVVRSIAVNLLSDEPGLEVKREFWALAPTGNSDPGGPIMYAYSTGEGSAREAVTFPMGVRGVRFWLDGPRAHLFVVRYRLQLSNGATSEGSNGSKAGDWSDRGGSIQHQLQWLWLSIEPKPVV
jgi:hypothetical protein